MQLADRIIVGGIAVAGLYGLVLLPLVPLLGSSHPALLELLRGSTASIINMGARARVGQTSFALAVLLGVPSVMMFDWLFWWAGRRWGDRVFIWLLGRDNEKARRRLARLHWLERRFGPLAVVLAPVLPIPSPLIYAAVGDGGMRLATFLVLDLTGTLLWTGLLATLGYELGQSAVDVSDAITHYSLWATLALVAAVITVQAVRTRGRPPRRLELCERRPHRSSSSAGNFRSDAGRRQALRGSVARADPWSLIEIALLRRTKSRKSTKPIRSSTRP
jgi:membrane-associated protein